MVITRQRWAGRCSRPTSLPTPARSSGSNSASPVMAPTITPAFMSTITWSNEEATVHRLTYPLAQSVLAMSVVALASCAEEVGPGGGGAGPVGGDGTGGPPGTGGDTFGGSNGDGGGVTCMS